MDTLAIVILIVLLAVPLVIVGAMFIWAAIRDGQEDRALQKRLEDWPLEDLVPELDWSVLPEAWCERRAHVAETAIELRERIVRRDEGAEYGHADEGQARD